ncbi:MAG: hypothetical protein M1829_003978 [Trizodia sp. TS-e1964]|nr:MAG: hypothetical protein M1829_003978 [Trizodia sp. TS-e1964]
MHTLTPRLLLLLLLPLFAALSTQATSPPARNSSSAKSCRSFTVALTITSENLLWTYPPFADNYAVSEFSDAATARDAPSAFRPFSGSQNATASYVLGARYCSPKGSSPSSNRNTTFVATHGINFDGSYWDSPISPAEYSFADFVIARGYSVLFYDRLGLGKSSRISGYVNQASIQIALLAQLTAQLKAGRLDAGKVPAPARTVLIGHSFGSALSNGLVAADPGAADALVLTGFAHQAEAQNFDGLISAWQAKIASGVSRRFRDHDSGYLTPVDLFANIYTFFRAPYYDREVAVQVDRRKQPFAITELISLLAVRFQAPLFSGPVLIITGEKDFIFCASDCKGDVLSRPAASYFSGAKEFATYVQPGAGHGLNFAKNATGAYAVITDFVARNFPKEGVV